VVAVRERGEVCELARRVQMLCGPGSVAAALCALLLVAPCVSAKKTINWWVGGASSNWTFLAKEYMKQHPNVNVVQLSGDMDKFYTMITAGLMPDIWGPWSTPGIRADVNRNWATDLTSYIRADSKSIDLPDFYPGLMAKFRVNGKQYSLPCFAYQDYFFYNTEMYAAAGIAPPPMDAQDKSWSWDKMVANGEKTTKYGADGTSIQVAGIEFLRDMFHVPQFFSIWGALFYSDKAVMSSVPQEMQFDTPQALTALTKAHDLIYKQRISSPAGNSFQSRRASQAMVPGWQIKNFMLQKGLKWAIANEPWGVTNQAHMNPDGWRIGKTCKDKALAWDFVKFLCSPASLTYLTSDPKSDFQGTPASRRSVFTDTLAPTVSRVTGMRPSDILTVHSQADQINDVIYVSSICIHADIAPFLQVTTDKLWQDKLSPAQAAKQLQDTANKRLPDLFKRWVRNIAFTGAEK
jgi:ABC-type glycerol-3-phosphate transport system substrate-binding protein